MHLVLSLRYGFLLCGALLCGVASAADFMVVQTDLATLAAAVGVSAEAIARDNSLEGPPTPGTVVRIPGVGRALAAEWTSGADARLRTGMGQSSEPRPGQHLPDVAEVCTGAQGAGALHLRSGPGAQDEVTIGSGTCVVFLGGSASEGRRTLYLNLLEGRVRVRSTDDDANVLVKSGKAVIVGTGYRVLGERNGVSVEVLDGAAQVFVNGYTTQLARNQAMRIPSRGAVGTVRPLASPPACTHPAPDATLTDAAFAWEAAPGAATYLFELARGRDFGEPLLAAETSTTRWEPDRLELPDGDALWWRVSAITPERLTGLPCAARRLALPRP